MSERVGTTELARKLGVSRTRINDLARRGQLTRESDGKWDPDRVAGELGRTLDSARRTKARIQGGQASRPRQSVQPADPDLPGMTGSAHDIFHRARAAKEIAIAKEKQLDLKLREGELLLASEVEDAWTRRVTAFKNRLMGLPDKLAQRLAAVTEDREVRAVLDAEIKAILQALSETTKADAA